MVSSVAVAPIFKNFFCDFILPEILTHNLQFDGDRQDVLLFLSKR